jgi:predicted nucleic acid-binding protein
VKRYVLDTNLYIEGARNRTKAEELKAFSSAFLPFLSLHAVVAQELLAGAISAEAKEEIERSLIAPFERRDRLIIPTWRAWLRSGEIIAELVRQKALSPGGFSRSFINDALLAASLRESGHVLITRNVGDFQLLARVERFQFTDPWPKAVSL